VTGWSRNFGHGPKVDHILTEAEILRSIEEEQNRENRG
jgi:hypothetical protein